MAAVGAITSTLVGKEVVGGVLSNALGGILGKGGKDESKGPPDPMELLSKVINSAKGE